jgi:hypothetical protein
LCACAFHSACSERRAGIQDDSGGTHIHRYLPQMLPLRLQLRGEPYPSTMCLRNNVLTCASARCLCSICVYVVQLRRGGKLRVQRLAGVRRPRGGEVPHVRPRVRVQPPAPAVHAAEPQEPPRTAQPQRVSTALCLPVYSVFCNSSFRYILQSCV